MRNTRGQALVEFILILPVFLLLVFASIDIGKIIYEKYRLQNDLDIVKDLYIQKDEQEMNRYLNKNHLSIAYEQNETYLTLIITKPIELMTPGLKQVLENPYLIKENITIIYETKS